MSNAPDGFAEASAAGTRESVADALGLWDEDGAGDTLATADIVDAGEGDAANAGCVAWTPFIFSQPQKLTAARKINIAHNNFFMVLPPFVRANRYKI